MNLPRLPEGHRWRLKRSAFVSDPLLVLEKKGWLFWNQVDENFIALKVWNNVDDAIERAAKKIMQRQNQRLSIPYGVLDTDPTH